MSQFYASIKGSARNDVTRQGSAKSGIRGHIRGWDKGVRVIGYTRRDEDGQEYDEFAVYLTGGSNGSSSDQLIGTF